jgi:hypothetical protein
LMSALRHKNSHQRDLQVKWKFRNSLKLHGEYDYRIEEGFKEDGGWPKFGKLKLKKKERGRVIGVR